MKHVLTATKTTSVTLQVPALELPQAVEHIENLCLLFQQWRVGEGSGCYQRIHADAVKISDVQQEGRRGRPPAATSAYDNFRQTVYLPFIDFVLLDMLERSWHLPCLAPKCASYFLGGFRTKIH